MNGSLKIEPEKLSDHSRGIYGIYLKLIKGKPEDTHITLFDFIGSISGPNADDSKGDNICMGLQFKVKVFFISLRFLVLN